jgi:hypothetical protein
MKQMERRWEDELPYLEATRAFYDTHFSLHCWLPFCVVQLWCLSSSLDIYTGVISCIQLSTSIFRLIGYHFTSVNSKGMVEKALMSMGVPRWFCNVLGLQCKRYWLFNNFVKEKSKLKILRKFGRALHILECDFINFRPKVVGDIEFESFSFSLLKIKLIFKK